MCLGDWKTHGSEYYECSRYKENPDIVNQSQQAQAREALKKYLFYFERVGSPQLSRRGLCGWPARGASQGLGPEPHAHRGRVGSCVALGDASIDAALGLHRAVWLTRKGVVLTCVGAGLEDNRATRAILVVRLRGQFLPGRPFSSPQRGSFGCRAQ